MGMGTLKKLLFLLNLGFLSALGGVFYWVYQDFQGYQESDNSLALERPEDFEFEEDTGRGISFYDDIANLKQGPLPEKAPPPPPPKDPDWKEGFLEKWTILFQPWVFGDASKASATLDDGAGNQKRVRVAPEGASVEVLLTIKRGKTDDEMEDFGLSPDDADDVLIDDLAGRKWAKVTQIDKDGITIANNDDETARISFKKQKTDFEEIGDGEEYERPTARKGGGREMPDVTRPIRPNEWEIGGPDQEDFSQNYGNYLDEVNLRAFYDPRTRRLQGLQIRSKVPAPKFIKFGLRNRDVIISVNGTKVTSASQTTELINRNREAEEVVVEILRNNRPMTLTYHLTPQEKQGPRKR